MSLLFFFKSNNYSNLFLLVVFFLSIFFISNQITNDLYLDIQKEAELKNLVLKSKKMEGSTEIRQLSENDNFFDIVIFDRVSKLRENRKIDGFGGGDGRHQVRWLYQSLEAKVYKAAIDIFGEELISIYTLIQATYIFATFFVIFLIISHIYKRYETKIFALIGLIFFSIFNLIASTGIQSSYTIPEVFFVSLGIYFSIKKQMLLFLIPLFFATINRESGIAVSFVYIIFNHKKIPSYFLPLIGFIILATVNFDLAKDLNFYKLSFYLPIQEDYSQKAPSNAQIIVAYLFILNLIFLSIFAYLRGIEIGYKIQLTLVTLLYFFVAIIGTNHTNVYSLLLMMPSFIVLLASLSKIKD